MAGSEGGWGRSMVPTLLGRIETRIFLLVANGPMRVPFLRWRFRGGRLA